MAKQTQIFYKSIYLCIYKAVNHNLCLYNMPFLLLLSIGLDMCCSVQSMKARKPAENTFQLHQGFAVSLSYYIFSVKLVCIVLSRIQSFGYLQMLLWSRSNRKPLARVQVM